MRCDGMVCRWAYYGGPRCVYCAPGAVTLPKRPAEGTQQSEQKKKVPRIVDRRGR